jgi:hypothetical protein
MKARYKYGNTAGKPQKGTVPPWIANHPVTQRALPETKNSTAIRA